jgi:Holliday junction resolvase
MKASRYEREFCRFASSKGFHAERVAGSGLRKASVCDVVLIKRGKGYLVEIKSTRDKVYYLSDKQGVRERIEKLIEVASRCKAIPLLAVRFKRRGWVVKVLSKGLKKVGEDERSFF